MDEKKKIILASVALGLAAIVLLFTIWPSGAPRVETLPADPAGEFISALKLPEEQHKYYFVNATIAEDKTTVVIDGLVENQQILDELKAKIAGAKPQPGKVDMKVKIGKLPISMPKPQ